MAGAVIFQNVDIRSCTIEGDETHFIQIIAPTIWSDCYFKKIQTTTLFYFEDHVAFLNSTLTEIITAELLVTKPKVSGSLTFRNVIFDRNEQSNQLLFLPYFTLRVPLLMENCQIRISSFWKLFYFIDVVDIEARYVNCTFEDLSFSKYLSAQYHPSFGWGLFDNFGTSRLTFDNCLWNHIVMDSLDEFLIVISGVNLTIANNSEIVDSTISFIQGSYSYSLKVLPTISNVNIFDTMFQSNIVYRIVELSSKEHLVLSNVKVYNTTPTSTDGLIHMTSVSDGGNGTVLISDCIFFNTSQPTQCKIYLHL
jgi:hypothetical protein